MKLFRLIKMCLNETYSKVCRGKNLAYISYSEWRETRRCFITIGLEYAIRKEYNQMEHISFWSVLMMLIYWEKRINTIKKNTEALLDASGEVGLEVNIEKTKYVFKSHHQNRG
jgi:hypothetical protein